MHRTKKLIATLVASLMIGSIGWMPSSDAASRAEIAQISVNQKGSNFKYWNKEAASYQALVAYVKDITNPKSSNFIPVEDRIAVFDMDGTFLCETAPSAFGWLLLVQRTLHDPGYRASEADRQFAFGLEHQMALLHNIPLVAFGMTLLNAKSPPPPPFITKSGRISKIISFPDILRSACLFSLYIPPSRAMIKKVFTD